MVSVHSPSWLERMVLILTIVYVATPWGALSTIFYQVCILSLRYIPLPRTDISLKNLLTQMGTGFVVDLWATNDDYDDDLGNTTYTTNDDDDPFPYEVDWWTVSSIFAKMQKIYIVAMTPKGVLNDVMETFFVFACCSHKSICSFLSCCNPFQYVYTFCCFWSCDKRIDTLKAFRVGVKIGLIFGGAGAAVGVGLGYLLSLTVLGCTMNLWTPGPGQRPRFSR